MNVLFILAIIFASVAVICFALSFILDDYLSVDLFGPFITTAIVSFFVGIVLAISGGAKYDAEYRQETVRLCNQQNGVVTTDGQCFVNNRPVEFSPGVWRR